MLTARSLLQSPPYYGDGCGAAAGYYDRLMGISKEIHTPVHRDRGRKPSRARGRGGALDR